MFIDIHSHIDEHNPAELPGILERASAAGVSAIVSAGTTLESARRCVDIGSSYQNVFAGVGVHPQNLKARLTSESLSELRRMAQFPRVAVISEIGLDFQQGSPPLDIQEEAFRMQIELAKESRLPIVFHNREATQDTLRILKDNSAYEVGGAAHYFQGDWNYAKALLDMGFKISLAKPLLRLKELQEIAVRLPWDCIVLETDSYPQPFKKTRDRWTEPKDILKIAEALAHLRNTSVEEVAARTTANVMDMLGLSNAALPEIKKLIY